MTLRYSRRSFRRVVWKSSQETWARLHEQAWRYFGGACQYVVLDNLKAVSYTHLDVYKRKQPRMSDLMRGKISLFSLDTLIDMAATAGMSPTVKVTKPKAKPRKHAKREFEAA